MCIVFNQRIKRHLRRYCCVSFVYSKNMKSLSIVNKSLGDQTLFTEYWFLIEPGQYFLTLSHDDLWNRTYWSLELHQTILYRKPRSQGLAQRHVWSPVLHIRSNCQGHEINNDLFDKSSRTWFEHLPHSR